LVDLNFAFDVMSHDKFCAKMLNATEIIALEMVLLHPSVIAYFLVVPSMVILCLPPKFVGCLVGLDY
jgi:hypothetical protein